MYIRDGIVYADDPTPILAVTRARKKENHCLVVAFNDGSVKEVDCTPLLDGVVFAPLKDQAKFDAFFVDLGTIVWENSQIDIAPEWLYRNGKPVSAFMPDAV